MIFERSFERVLRAKGGQEDGTVAVIHRELFERSSQELDFVDVHRGDRNDLPPVVGGERPHQPFGVAAIGRQTSGVEEGLGECGITT